MFGFNIKEIDVAYAPCSCPDEEHCGLRMIMSDVREAVASVLDRATLADGAARVSALTPAPLPVDAGPRPLEEVR